MEAARDVVLAFVLNAAWQVPVMALAAAATSRLLPSAAARHRLLLVALGGSLLLPIAGSLGSGHWRFWPEAAPAVSAASPPWASGAARPSRYASPRWPAPSPRVAAGVGGLYLGLLVLGVLSRIRALRRAGALRRSALPGPPPRRVAREAERCRRRLGLGAVGVRLSPAVASPVTLGARRPLILLPARLAGGWTRRELAAALAHEMAHVKRRDFAWNAAALLAAAPIAFHPATRWLLRRIRQARELACDALVAERVLESRSYARALAGLARSIAPAPAFTLGVADAGILEERVMSLVDGRARRRAGGGPSLAAALLFAAVAVAAASHAVAVDNGGTASAVVGSWTGRVAQWGDMPALELDIMEKDGRLSGRATYYLMQEGPTGLRVGGKDEIDVLEPRFDAARRRLSFKVKSPDGKTHSIELRLTGEGEGDYVEVGAGAEVDAGRPHADLVVKMKKSK